MPIRRLNCTAVVKSDAVKAAVLAKISANPDRWPPKYFGNLLSSLYRNASNHKYWVSHGPLTEPQYEAMLADPDVINLVNAGSMWIYRDRDKTPQELFVEIGISPEVVE